MQNKMAESIFEELKNNSTFAISELLKDFTKGEVGVISYLVFENDGVTAGELSEKLNVTTARIASILKSLEGKDLIKRTEDPIDKRKIIVSITTNGKKQALAAKKDIIEKIKILADKIGLDDMKEYLRIIKKIKQVLKED